ncbi:unnamed protein product [Durusdinium trenchii]|uniref:Uncharacterized protein n=1 Tax=Durusdinium trenchii TaxID=1381693 RepID=A0ABP0RQ40_9DINO
MFDSEKTSALVWRLRALAAPKVFIFAVLLTLWTSIPDPPGFDEDTFQCIEFFAGKGELSRTQKLSGKSAVRLDLEYMDANHKGRNVMNILTPEGMALAIRCILRGDPTGFLCHFGLKCSTWSTVNVGTSCRSERSSLGNCDHESVRSGNAMASRVILLATLVVALGGCFTVEQPGGSFLEYYPRWRDFLRVLDEVGGDGTVHRVTWHMLHYGGPTPKPHWAVSNSRRISELHRGKFDHAGWKAKPKSERDSVKTTIKYQDKQGKDRFKGSSRLRKSEEYPVMFGLKLVELYEWLVGSCRGQPSLPPTIPTALETFQSMGIGDDEESLWSEASIVEVCKYLRGGTSLLIPPDFRPFLPRRL